MVIEFSILNAQFSILNSRPPSQRTVWVVGDSKFEIENSEFLADRFGQKSHEWCRSRERFGNIIDEPG